MIAYDEFEISSEEMESGKMGEVKIYIWKKQKVVIKSVGKDDGGNSYKHFFHEVSGINAPCYYFLLLVALNWNINFSTYFMKYATYPIM